jgi:prepilin-type N-terminal cleavage/methylation domain-containing protein
MSRILRNRNSRATFQRAWSGARGEVRTSAAGMTLIELVLACAILLILASAALPLARVTIKRNREAALRYDLLEMRTAIDRYKDAADKGQITAAAGTEGYPPDLATLVHGVPLATGAGLPGGAGIGGTTPGVTPGSGFGSSSGIGGNSGFGGTSGIGGNTGIGGNSGPGGSSTGILGGGTSLGTGPPKNVRFLRSVPTDPMTGTKDWGLRSVQDDPDSTSWGGQCVFDVFSRSSGTALDGTKYSDW